MSTIVYRYGLRFPTCGVDAALEQLAASHRYRNQLVELERTRRAKLRAAESKDSAVAQRLGAMQGAQTKLDATAPVFEVGLEPDPSPERGDQPPFAVNVGGPGRRHFTSHFITCPKREAFSRKESNAKEVADG